MKTFLKIIFGIGVIVFIFEAGLFGGVPFKTSNNPQPTSFNEQSYTKDQGTDTYSANKKKQSEVSNDYYASTSSNTSSSSAYKPQKRNYYVPYSTPSSSCFSYIAYNEYQEKLMLCFRDSGDSYEYYNVPQNVFDSLKNASSMGNYYNNYIKDYYSWQKLPDDAVQDINQELNEYYSEAALDNFMDDYYDDYREHVEEYGYDGDIREWANEYAADYLEPYYYEAPEY